MRKRLDRNDSGSSLIIVIAFLIIIGVVTVALLNRTRTNLRVNATSSLLNDRLYAAEAGVNYAIQSIRRDPSQCQNATGQAVVNATPAINNRTATVYCKFSNGATLGVNGLGLVVVSNANRGGVRDGIPGGIEIFNRDLTDTPSLIAGGAYIEGSMQQAPTTVRAAIGGGCSTTDACDIEVTGGDLIAYDSSCAAAPNDSFDITPFAGFIHFFGSPVFRTRCFNDANRLDLNRIDPGLPDGRPEIPGLNPPPPAAAPTSPIAGCTIWSPGTYTGAKPALTQDNFFLPGIYYFNWQQSGGNNLNGGNDVTIGSATSSAANKQHVVGGRPTQGESREIPMDASMNACAATVPAGVTGGVEFVFGGPGRFLIQYAAQVELFTRIADGVPRPNIYVVPDTPEARAAGWNPSTHTVASNSNSNQPNWAQWGPVDFLPIVDTANNGQCSATDPNANLCRPQVTYHGLIWAPDGQVDFHSRAGIQNFLGGVVARQLFIGPYTNISSSPLSGGTGAGSRVMTLVALVQSLPGEKVMVAQAEVTISNDETRSATVTGWTVCTLPAGTYTTTQIRNACNN